MCVQCECDANTFDNEVWFEMHVIMKSSWFMSQLIYESWNSCIVVTITSVKERDVAIAHYSFFREETVHW